MMAKIALATFRLIQLLLSLLNEHHILIPINLVGKCIIVLFKPSRIPLNQQPIQLITPTTAQNAFREMRKACLE
ncbi:hypothetical protein GGR51DRAFT_509640 [Nemania sp. FL0031]|nr:hypothetical protein GGR51DRAFT_509640 [Nemania sp. FL0031]